MDCHLKSIYTQTHATCDHVNFYVNVRVNHVNFDHINFYVHVHVNHVNHGHVNFYVSR